MSSISGFCDFTTDYSQGSEHYSQILASMNRAQAHRGPDGQGVYLAPHIGLAHSRLSVTHLDAGGEPLLKTIGPPYWTANSTMQKSLRRIWPPGGRSFSRGPTRRSFFFPTWNMAENS